MADSPAPVRCSTPATERLLVQIQPLRATRRDPMQQRPKGVTVLALLALVGGILSFAAGYVLMLVGGLGSAFGASGGGTVMVLGALTFAIGLSSFMLGYGFWAMKPWAWPAAFLLYGVAIAVNLASVLFAGASVVSVIFPVVIAAAVMWYLLQPQKRAVFGR